MLRKYSENFLNLYVARFCLYVHINCSHSLCTEGNAPKTVNASACVPHQIVITLNSAQLISMCHQLHPILPNMNAAENKNIDAKVKKNGF